MAANFCIPKDVSSIIKDSISSGDLTMADKLLKNISDKNGASLTEDQIKQVYHLADQVSKLSGKTDSTGGQHPDFFTAIKNLDDYKQSLMSKSKVRTFLNITKNNLIFSTSSGLKSFTGQTIGTMLSMSKRVILSGGKLFGSNPEVATGIWNKAWKVYKDTGINMLNTTDLDTVWGSGEKRAAGAGPIGRFTQDVVMKYLHGAPHNLSYITNWTHTADMESTRMAHLSDDVINGKMDVKEKASQIMKDAANITPTTEEGAQVRAQAKLDAETASNIGETPYSQAAQGMKDFYTKHFGPFIANWLMPMTTVTANVAGWAADISGVGPIRVVGAGLFKAFNGGLDKEATQTLLKDLAVKSAFTGIGVTAAYGIKQAIVGQQGGVNANFWSYPTTVKEKQLMEEQGGNYNSVRIGSHIIPLDIFGPLGSALNGMLSAEKYGNGSKIKSAEAYIAGSGEQFLNQMPGVSSISAIYQQGLLINPANAGAAKTAQRSFEYGIGNLYGRLIPSFVAQIALQTDTKQRDVTGGNLDYLKEKIPGVRETLPVKKTETGEDIASPGATAYLLGVGAKVPNDSPIAKEFGRLDANGYGVSLVKPTTEKRFQTLKKEKGDAVYNTAVDEFNTQLAEKLNTLVSSGSYKSAKIDSKQKQITKIHTDLMDQITNKYGFTKEKKPVVTAL